MNETHRLKHYPENVPTQIPPLTKTLNELFSETCKKFGNKTAFISFDTPLSFNELFDRSRDLTAFLQNHCPIKEGDKIIIQLPNLLQFPISLWASIRSGLIPVPMNPLYTPREMLHQIKDSEARTIITLSSCGKTLESIIDQTKLQTVIVTEPGDSLSFTKKTLVNFVFNHIQKNRQPLKKLKKTSFLKALALGQKSLAETKDRAFKAPLLYQYTGGTTGFSKGVVLSQKNILSNIKQCELWMTPSLEKGKERFLTALPLFHIFSLMLNGLVLFLNGNCGILEANPRNIKNLIRLLKKYPPTVMTGVNTLFKALMENPHFKNLDFSELKFSIAGGMSLDSNIQKKWQSLTRSSLVEGYGLTEASPIVCCNDLLKPRAASVGMPLPSTKVRTVDEQGKELPLGEKGELEVKGPQVMESYYNQPEETQKILNSQGWLKTGDIATIDQEGFISILDRKKDMINVSGFNVFPSEVESVIQSLSEVREAAVIGVSSKKSGEVPKAFIVRQKESLTKEKILNHCKAHLSLYKIPKIIEFTDSIPKTLIGKPLRKALRSSSTESIKNVKHDHLTKEETS